MTIAPNIRYLIYWARSSALRIQLRADKHSTTDCTQNRLFTPRCPAANGARRTLLIASTGHVTSLQPITLRVPENTGNIPSHVFYKIHYLKSENRFILTVICETRFISVFN
jgi:hypothetical protein